MSNNGPFFFSFCILFIAWISSCTQHSSSKLGSVFVCKIFPWERPLLLFFIFITCFLYVRTADSPADLADLRRQTTKPQNSLNLKQIVFLCVIMQLAAFLCVICVICGRIYIQTYSIKPHRRNPNVSRRSRRFTQTNNKQQTAFSLRPLRENKRAN